MIFLGLDLSITGSGVVLIDESYKIVDKIVLHSDTIGIERLFHLENQFITFLNPYFKLINLVCIESPAFGAREGQLFNIGEVKGIFKVNLFKHGKEIIFAAPTQVKKVCWGTGTGTKDLMLLKVFQNFGEEFLSHDLADAYVLARIARDYYFLYIKKANVELKKYQKEVLKKINKLTIEDDESLITSINESQDAIL
jgi:Holliday junction resolvasome RuvABC endonuclease subunit